MGMNLTYLVLCCFKLLLCRCYAVECSFLLVIECGFSSLYVHNRLEFYRGELAGYLC